MVIGFFAGSNNRQIKKFVEQFQWTFPVGKEKGIASKLDVKRLPETLFISRNGEISKRLSGGISSKDIQDGIKDIL